MADRKNSDKIIAFEYALLNFINWSLEKKVFADFTDFDQRNDYSKNKILLLNFFLATANGHEHREEMFKFFNSFYARPMGYIEADVEKNIHLLRYIQLNEQFNKIGFSSQFKDILDEEQKIDF